MLKNSKDFKRKLFSDISKAKVMTVKIIATYAIINSITFLGAQNSLMFMQASASTNYDGKGDFTFVPASEVVVNMPVKNKEIVCSSTAYTGGGKTASGRICERNPNGISTVSVDPSIIPLGTIVHIEGYGYAVAADTGGSVKGNKIDVYFNSLSECYNWGKRSVKVTILGES